MKTIETIQEFEQLTDTNKPILLDFYADWCGPCQSLLPIVEDLSNVYNGKVDFIKINVDQFQDLARNYQVRSIPALFFIKDGQIIERTQGLLTKSILVEKLDQLSATVEV